MHEPTTPLPPDGREEATAFREVFLLHAPGGGAPLRRFGRYMYEILRESGSSGALAPRVHATILAVAEDLRFSGEVLTNLVADEGLTPEERALAIKASSWAREVFDLARAIEGAAGNPGGSP